MITARQIADYVSGQLIGEETIHITGVSSIGEAGPGDLAFIDNPKYASYLKDARASLVIIGNGCPCPDGKSVIVVDNPTLSFSKALELFMKPEKLFHPGIHQTACIHQNCTLGENVSIGPNVVIEEDVSVADDVSIGAGCYIGVETKIGQATKLYPGISVLARSVIGKNVVIHAGTVIGSDGFGFTKVNGKNAKLPQLGNVVIEDDVEIGANVTIDRARFGSTVIGQRTKIDNLVQIAHNVWIGADSIIVAQAGIAGSATLEKNVTIAGQVGVGGHLKIGESAIIMGQSGVSKDVPAGEKWFGYPARNAIEANKQQVFLKKIPELMKKIKMLEKEIHEIKKN